MNSPATPRYPVLNITLEEKAVVATLDVSEDLAAITTDDIEEQVKIAGFGDARMDKNALKKLLDQAQINEHFSIKIAELVDASIALKVSRDKMSVQADIVAAAGGLALTEEAIFQVLRTHKISLGCVSKHALAAAITEKSKSTYTIAEGVAALNGDDTVFRPLFRQITEHPPIVDAEDMTQYFETNDYVSVEEGDCLMRRIPATAGVDGFDVTGKKIKAKKGKDKKFKKQKGSVVDEEDENLLRASCQGHPIIAAQGVKVDKVLILVNADLKSGNIDFDGTVIISGQVFSQITIVASGDLHVKGSVENATLSAGHDLIIGGGVIGESTPDIDEPPKITSNLRAGNDIRAMFLNLTEAFSGHDIHVQKYAMNTNLTAKRDIIIGGNGGKGAIICGNTISGRHIEVNVLGSNAYLKTLIDSGSLCELHVEEKRIKNGIKQRSTELIQLKTILAKIVNKDPEKIGSLVIDKSKKLTSAIASVEGWLLTLKEEETEVNNELGLANEATVQVHKMLYPNVRVLVNDVEYLGTVKKRACKIFTVNGNIELELE